VGSRLRGKDVKGEWSGPGMEGGTLAMSHRHPTQGAALDLIRRPGDRRAFRLNNREAPHPACGCRFKPDRAHRSWRESPIVARGTLRT